MNKKVKVIGGILGGLAFVALEIYLFDYVDTTLSDTIGWLLFIALMLGLLGYIFGNPFAKKVLTNDSTSITPLEPNTTVPTTRSLTEHEI